MPKGPKGQKRPADVVGAAVMIGKIAIGELEDPPKESTASSKGGEARAKSLTKDRRKEIAKKAAVSRWNS